VLRRRLSVYFLYLAWRLWRSVVTLAVTRNTISNRLLRRQRMPMFELHRLALTGVDGHTVAELSWKDADFLCISCI
jgi:hypothetical protein